MTTLEAVDPQLSDFSLLTLVPSTVSRRERRSEPSLAYRTLKKLDPDMQAGKSYAFDITFPLSQDESYAADGHEGESLWYQQRLRELQVSLNFNHKALLVGTVTMDSMDFEGMVYQLAAINDELDTEADVIDWVVGTHVDLTSRGAIMPGWTQEKILAIGDRLNYKFERGGKFGFEKWHCGMFVEELCDVLKWECPRY